MRRGGLAAVLFLSACAAPRRAAAPKPWGFVGHEYAVAADHPLASAAGASIFAAGGNAVDAAAATSFALAVVRPFSAGLGGGGFMMIKLRGREPVVIDYRETAPSGAEPEAYLGPDGRPVPGKTVSGPWAVGVPGYLRGVPEALAKFGTLPLAEVMRPAIELAEGGIPVDPVMREAMADIAGRIAKAEDPSRYAEIARVFLKDGKPYAVGEVLRQPDLAATLRMVAAKGPEAFYRGELADKVLAAVGPGAGPMTAEDLEGYAPVYRTPLAGTFRGRTVLGMPPPSSGGACVIQVLDVLDGFSARRVASPGGAPLLVEAMKHAFADRARLLGDPDAHPEVEENAAAMLAPKHVAALRRQADAAHTLRAEEYGVHGLPDDSGTTHYSVMDAAGNAVTATETVNLFFGSMVVPPGTGIVLNDQLDDFAVSTAAANAFGLSQSALNLIGPGRRPLSSMSPTLLLERGEPVLAAGGSGGPRIITGVIQAIVGVLDRRLSPDDALAFPRLHHQWSPDVVRVEAGVVPEAQAALAARGHRLEADAGENAVQLVVRSSGLLSAASDPRKGGRPAGR